MRSSSILAVMEDCCWVSRRRASSSLSGGEEESDINEKHQLLGKQRKDADFEGSNLQHRGERKIKEGKYYFSHILLWLFTCLYIG